jgi:cation diffusion facilitator family transporter
MHSDPLEQFTHAHDSAGALDMHERRTRAVVAITFAMMLAELIVGRITNSLALTADGWHMASHAGALGLSALAYWFARTRARAARFTFGTGKVYALAGYTSAVALAIVAAWMIGLSASRFVHPEAVRFGEALPIAVIGLVVNLVSAALLHHDEDDHGHAHDHQHADDHDDHADHHGRAGHGAHRHDHNLRSAYVHVLADALTSVLAIAALVGGRYAGWTFLDPVMGIVGGVVILRWSYGLCVGAGAQLLDVAPDHTALDRIRGRLESMDDVRVADLHLWELGPGRRGCIASVVTSRPRAPADYHAAIRASADVAHITVEVHHCQHESAA